MTNAPIALFVYNRLEHTKKTIEALQRNFLASESELFIFSDGPKDSTKYIGDKEKVAELRNYLKSIKGFKKVEIVERAENLGLAKSIISGVTDIVNRFGKIIVMEDDLVSSPYFLTYMNDGLDSYENNQKVISIHGYVYPTKKSLPETFFIHGADCWGWATWKRGWDKFEKDGSKLLQELQKGNLINEFDFNRSYPFSNMLERQISGKNDSWAIRWNASAFLANMLTLYPGVSLIDNIGQDSSGTHGKNSKVYKTKISDRKIEVGKIPVEENRETRKIFENYFNSLKPGLFARILIRLRKQKE